ncbi:hypothetical protein D3C80_594200 [compost metagenome]
MRYVFQARHQVRQAPRGKHQRIATGQDDLPDGGVRIYIVECGVKLGRAHHAIALRPDHFPAETEAAIDGADVHCL